MAVDIDHTDEFRIDIISRSFQMLLLLLGHRTQPTLSIHLDIKKQ